MALSATQLNFEYSVLTHNQSTGAFQECPALSVITLHNGQLTVNGQPISNPQFTTSQVNWTQQSTDSYSTGSLTVENGGMELNGVVSIGTTAQDSVDNLYQLSDEQVQGQVQTVFGSQLQTAPAVQSTFFPGATPPPVEPLLPGWVNNVAIAMVCSSIARSSLYGFSGTVNMNAADQYWQTQINGAQGIQTNNALYDWAFPSYCQGNGQTFANYLDQNAASWGEQLVEMVTSAAFLNTFATKIISASPNWPQQLNLIFYKIKRLAPDQLASVRPSRQYRAVHGAACE